MIAIFINWLSTAIGLGIASLLLKGVRPRNFLAFAISSFHRSNVQKINKNQLKVSPSLFLDNLPGFGEPFCHSFFRSFGTLIFASFFTTIFNFPIPLILYKSHFEQRLFAKRKKQEIGCSKKYQCCHEL